MNLLPLFVIGGALLVILMSTIFVMVYDAERVKSDSSKKSFFNLAAWCSFFIPFITAIFTFDGHNINSDSHAADIFLLVAFCLQIFSIVLGIVSLFGISRHGARLILWKAVIGILASCGMGLFLILCAMVGL